MMRNSSVKSWRWNGSSFASAAGRTGNGNSSGGDLEGLLELLHEVGQLEEGHLLERVEQLVGGELRHGGVLPFSLAR